MKDPIPSFAKKHPVSSSTIIYGVGVSSSYLNAKANALNDIATQLKLEVRSITSVNKSTKNEQSTISENITMLTNKKIQNYTIVEDKIANNKHYILIKYLK